jgi:hypothetical protein
VITEYVLGVAVRNKRGKPSIVIPFAINNLQPDDTTIIMVNSVPVLDTESVLSINPSEVEKIDVVRRNYVIGSINARGIINFILKPENSGRLDKIKGINRIRIEGLKTRTINYLPDHNDDPDSRIPDLRRDLYWNGHMAINEEPKEIRFYCSDIAGEYEVIISGKTESGKLIEQELSFTVKPLADHKK